MSKRIDIIILKTLDKEDDSSDLIELTELVNQYGKDYIFNFCSDMAKKDLIRFRHVAKPFTHDGNGNVLNEKIDKIIAKIQTEGRDYLEDYKNRKTTRRIAYWGIGLSIAALGLSGLAILIQYLSNNPT